MINPDKLFIYGKSLGGAVAIKVAWKHSSQVWGLILENTFTNIPEMVDHIFPVLKYVKKLVLKINWPSINRIPEITCPIMFVSGLRDEIVPADHMQRLHDNANKA